VGLAPQVRHEVVERLGERFVGLVRVGGAPPEQHGAALVVRTHGDFAHQARLPYAGLTFDQHGPPAALLRPLPAFAQTCHHVIPGNERRARLLPQRRAELGGVSVRRVPEHLDDLDVVRVPLQGAGTEATQLLCESSSGQRDDMAGAQDLVGLRRRL
jgi:hypothetical protein